MPLTHRSMCRLGGASASLLAILAFVACGDAPVSPAGSSAAGGLEALPELSLFEDTHDRLAAFEPVTVEADLSKLDETERTVLGLLVEASQGLDDIFLRQANRRNVAYRNALARIPGAAGAEALDLFDVHFGVYERQRGWNAFVMGVPPHPRGAGFYPEDLRREEWETFLREHPDREAELISLTTMVVRKEGQLVGIPYSKFFAKELSQVTRPLLEAARITRNDSLKDYLVLLAGALSSDNYRRADLAWMDVDSPVELTLGPFEVYEDGLFAYKAAFESFVTVVDPVESRRLDRLKPLLGKMEQSLPLPEQYNKTRRGSESPLRVADLVYSAGLARAGIQTAAFNLPNDEMVRELKGSKKVLLVNMIELKFEKTMRPIAQRVLVEPQAEQVDKDLFRDHVLLHEMSHGMGPGRILVDGHHAEVREVLLETYPPIEEAKADLCGLWNLLFLRDQGEFSFAPERLYATYLASLFRSTRFGTASAHGRGSAIQFRLLEEGGAIRFDASGKAAFVARRFRPALRAALERILRIEATGDYEAARQLIETHGSAPKKMKLLLSQLDGVPTDLRPSFPLP